MDYGYNVQIDPNGDSITVDDLEDMRSHIENKDNPHKVTAEQIGAASAGYGLGENISSKDALEDANSATLSGWYKIDANTKNGVGASAVLRVDGYSSRYATQTALSASTGHIKKRTCIENVWSEWEWENPPLAKNVEYRTTERCGTAPVYTKLVDVGAFPNATELNFQHGIENVNYVLEWHAINIATGTNIENSQQIDWIRVTRTSIDVKTNADASSWNVRFVLKYTKTTN